ncbi:MAG: hypothetical protein GX750_03330 [Clostridia bacterium]|nr:hypothetical protein [Clostridia bacterium]
MSLQTFYLGDLNPGSWQEVFVFCLQYADRFSARFLQNDEEMSEGFNAFFRLPGIEVSGWLGMPNGIEINGPLTEEARELLYQLQEPAFYGERPELWDVKLFSQGREILSIGDFTQRLIHLTDEELDFLIAQEIDFSDWEAIAMAVAESETDFPVEWDEEDLREVAEIISRWLSSDKKH